MWVCKEAKVLPADEHLYPHRQDMPKISRFFVCIHYLLLTYFSGNKQCYADLFYHDL